MWNVIIFFQHRRQQENKYWARSEKSYKYVFQSVETCGSVVTYESVTVSGIRSLATDGSPGIFTNNAQNWK